MKERITVEVKELHDMRMANEIEPLEYLDYKEKLQNRVMTCDKKIMEKRKMILDISKENIMTIQSALRSIPKKPKEKETSKMAAMLEKRHAR
jgi:hypothetical protein